LNEVTRFENYGGEFNLEKALNNIIGQIKANTAVFIVSDFIDVQGEWKSKMLVSSKKFRHVMNVMVRDLRDYKLPEAGNYRFEDISTGEQMVVNTSKIREEFNKKALEQEGKIMDKVEGAGASIIKVDTRDEFAGKFAEYFDEEGANW